MGEKNQGTRREKKGVSWKGWGDAVSKRGAPRSLSTGAGPERVAKKKKYP